LSLVKLLIEPDVLPPEARKGSKTNKRRRLEDRVTISSDMLKVAVKRNATDIVNYFIHEKRCVPDLQTLYLMTRDVDAE